MRLLHPVQTKYYFLQALKRSRIRMMMKRYRLQGHGNVDIEFGHLTLFSKWDRACNFTTGIVVIWQN